MIEKFKRIKSNYIDFLIDRDKVEEFIGEPFSNWLIIRYIATIFSGIIVLTLIPLYGLALTIVLPFIIGISIIIYFDEMIYTSKRRKKMIAHLIAYSQSLVDKHTAFVLKDKHKYKEYPNTADDLKHFIKRFIKWVNQDYHTFNLNGTLQCDHGRRRSAGDIFLICRNYYPECTFMEVLNHLASMYNEHEINGSRCGEIHKFVFYSISSSRRSQDEVEFLEGYTFDDIIKLCKEEYGWD